MFNEVLSWVKEPDSTTNLTDDGYLWFTGSEDDKKLFEIRFKYEPKEGYFDRWTLTYLPTGRQWSRDGIAEEDLCKFLAERFLEKEIKK